MLVDTAGLRRQAKVGESLEYYTALRSQRAAERADVALVVCDATDGVTSQDFRIAEMAMKSGCATALVLNKWDLQADGDDGVGPDELDHERARVNRKLRLRPRVLTASAKTGRHVERILVEAVGLADRSRGRIPTPQLNRFLSESSPPRQPPAGKRPPRQPAAEAALHDARPASGRRASRSRSTRTRWSPATTPTSSRTGCASATGSRDPADDRLRRAQRAPRARWPRRRRAAQRRLHTRRGVTRSSPDTFDPDQPDNEFLFTSESVTEGHPDKIADQISDGVLDAVLARRPDGRVACETLVNTGLVVVSGEITTSTYVDIQEIARETIRKIGYTDADVRLRLQHLRGASTRSTSSRRTSPRASTRPTRRAPRAPATSSTSPAPATRE